MQGAKAEYSLHIIFNCKNCGEESILYFLSKAYLQVSEIHTGVNSESIIGEYNHY